MKQWEALQQCYQHQLCKKPGTRLRRFATGQPGPLGEPVKTEQQASTQPSAAPNPPPQQPQAQQRKGKEVQQQSVQQSQPSKIEQLPEQEQLWWVEKFEEKRKELEQQQPSLSSSSKATTRPGTAAPTPAAAAAAAATAATATAGIPAKQPTPHIPWPTVLLQLLQLTAAVSALILWPASLYRTGLYSGKVWLLFCTYVLFFGGGSVWRLLQYGPLASRKKDQQAKSLKTRAAWALFVAMMPVLHWGAVGSFMTAKAKAAAAAAAQQGFAESGYTASLMGALTLYDVIGLALLLGAVWLNWRAARHLGRAYDRVVQPEALVTTGPYAWVQHPIYSSYMMLFCGYAMFLHSFGYALLALVVCLVYYKSRVALEAGVLQEAFGDKYVHYQQNTKLFVPFVI